MISRDGGFRPIRTDWSRFFKIFRESSDDDASWKTFEYKLLSRTFFAPFYFFIFKDSRFMVCIKVLKLNSITSFESFHSELKIDLLKVNHSPRKT